MAKNGGFSRASTAISPRPRATSEERYPLASRTLRLVSQAAAQSRRPDKFAVDRHFLSREVRNRGRVVDEPSDPTAIRPRSWMPAKVLDGPPTCKPLAPHCLSLPFVGRHAHRILVHGRHGKHGRKQISGSLSPSVTSVTSVDNLFEGRRAKRHIRHRTTQIGILKLTDGPIVPSYRDQRPAP
jgi:hypothetical protein